MLKDAKTLLAEHLRVLMSAHPRLKDRASVAQKTGMSARSVGSMLQGTGNPTLEHIEAVAKAFDLRAWELLIDREREKQRLMERLFATSSPADDPPSAGESPPTLQQPRRTYKN